MGMVILNFHPEESGLSLSAPAFTFPAVFRSPDPSGTSHFSLFTFHFSLKSYLILITSFNIIVIFPFLLPHHRPKRFRFYPGRHMMRFFIFSIVTRLVFS